MVGIGRCRARLVKPARTRRKEEYSLGSQTVISIELLVLHNPGLRVSFALKVQNGVPNAIAANHRDIKSVTTKPADDRVRGLCKWFGHRAERSNTFAQPDLGRPETGGMA
jgi:hypothetical protein